MGKAAFAAPIYVSVSWTLMASYQLFTQTAVATVLENLSALWPSVGLWLSQRIEIIVFIYAFAWVFVLSSVIPSVILGKERSVLVQFFVCLILSFSAILFTDVLTTYGIGPLTQITSLTVLFTNLFLALIYLSIPSIFMIALDVYSRKKRRKEANSEVIPIRYEEQADSEDHSELVVMEDIIAPLHCQSNTT